MSCDGLAIKCEGLGKRYLVPRRSAGGGALGELRDHLKEYAEFARGPDEDDYIWALRDVSFEVEQGSVLGIVGRNGSGKSTLLKILSGVTEPTTGRAVLKGRIGSLLEVGTGFHPDMSGRENIFMAGALLGLSQREIKGKLDEIIDFAEIGRFNDAPVKRYSSGMYMRLAFSVASLLRSDILILDEVLAVGDAGFREKSERAINRIAKDGRTVLLVSHSMQAIRHMCQTAIVLDQGRIVAHESADEAVRDYMRLVHEEPVEKVDIRTLDPRVDLADREDKDWPRPFKTIRWIETRDAAGPTRVFNTGDTMIVRIGYRMPELVDPCYFTIFGLSDLGERMFVSYSYHFSDRTSFPQEGVLECRLEDIRLLDGSYFLEIDFGRLTGPEPRFLDFIPRATEVIVEQRDFFGERPNLRNQGQAQRCAWSVEAAELVDA